MPITITDLPVMDAADVAGSDLLLVHRLIGGGYVPYAAVRSALLTDVVKTNSAANVASLTATAEVSAGSFIGASANLSGFVQVGDRLSRIRKSDEVSVVDLTVGAGNVATSTVGLSGVLPGDFCIISTTGAPDGVVITAQAGAGSMSVQICNVTAASIGPVSFTFRIGVLRVDVTP